MPVADKIRLMRVLADKVGKKRLKDSVLKKFTRLLTFFEAISSRVTTVGEARRMPKGARLTHRIQQESIGMLIRIGKPKIMELAPVTGIA